MTEKFSKHVNTFLLSCHFEKHIQYIIVMRAISWSDMFKLSVFLSKSQNYSLGHLQHFSQHLSSIAFDLLHICTSLHYWTITSVDCAHQYQIWMAGACQGFSAQRDVASCRKRESRGKAKQDIFRSVRGAAPLLLSALGGKFTKGSAFSPSFYPPLFCPHPALLCSAWDVFSLLILLFSPVTLESNSNGCHLQDLDFWQLPVSHKITLIPHNCCRLPVRLLLRFKHRSCY